MTARQAWVAAAAVAAVCVLESPDASYPRLALSRRTHRAAGSTRSWRLGLAVISALACLATVVVALAASAGWAKSRAPGSTAATGLGAASVYWDNPQTGAIGRSGGPPSQPDQSFITGIRQIDRLGVAVDRQYVYWTDGPWIGRANLDGSGVNQQFIPAPNAVFALAVDDQHLYWVGWGPSIGRANLDGSGVDSQFITVPGGRLSGVALDSSFVYWTDLRGTVGRANLDGTGITQSFVAEAGYASGVAVDGRYIYWTQVVGDLSSHGPYGGAIGRANLDGTGANPSFITGASFPWGVTVDYGYIYWANGYTCDYWTIPQSSCGGGTIGRANLDGSAVNQSYITADQGVGTGCASNLARCGPYSVALSAPTQPGCLRTDPPSAPPIGGAVFAQPLDPGGTGANVVVLPAGVSWTGPDSCAGIAAGSDEVMTHPTSISVAPDAAVLLQDQTAALFSAWGAQNVGADGSVPVLFPGRTDWQTTEADIVTPQGLLDSYHGCPACSLPNNLQITPGQPSSNVAYRGDFSGAALNGATLSGSFDGWNFSGAQLTGASLNAVSVSAVNFTGADLQGAAFTALQFQTPPSFARATLGGRNTCTSISNTNLLEVSFAGTAWVSGCTGALFSGSQVPLSTVQQLLVTGKATGVDWTGAHVIASGADRKALAGADLTGVNLAGVNFLGEPLDLTGTRFDNATLIGTNLALARLAGATFENVNAAGASFSDADLSGDGTHPGANFAGKHTNLQGANFVNTNISGASFESADLTDAVFTGARGRDTDFNSVVARSAVFSWAHLYGNGEAFDTATDLENIDFSNAVLASDPAVSGGFDFTGANLAGARFDGAVCVGCNLDNATLNQASFTGAYLPGAVLSGATLSGTSFDRAWLYCGSLANDGCASVPGAPPQWAWPLVLGSGEVYGPVPFGASDLTGVSLADVTACPDGKPGSTPPVGCEGHLLPNPSEAPQIPAPCSASAHGACPTATATIVDASTFCDASTVCDPRAIVPTAPPGWNTLLSGEGYYAAFDDGTIRLAGYGPATIIAGTSGEPCKTATATCGDGGPATAALLGTPNGLAVGLDGSLYVADPALLRIRRIDPSGIITTVAGTGVACTATAPGSCGDGSPAIQATLAGANGVWVDTHGVLIIADGLRGVRRVSVDGTITTLAAAGTASNSSFQAVAEGLDGMIYATTRGPDSIIQIDPATGAATLVVGTGTSGYNGNSDTYGNLLPGTQVQVNQPTGLSVNLEGNILFADTGNALIRAYVPSTTYIIDDLAGVVVNDLPQRGFNGDGLCATDTQLLEPWGVTATRSALLVVADSGNRRIRQVGPGPVDGSASCVAASGSSSASSARQSRAGTSLPSNGPRGRGS